MDYGYTGEVLLPVTLTAPADARPGGTTNLSAHASFLVCKDVCVPEDGTVSLALPIVAGDAGDDPQWGPRIAATLAAAPQPTGALRAALTPGGALLKLSVSGAPAAGAQAAYFYPYDGDAIAPAAAQAIDRGPNGVTLTLSPGSAFKNGSGPAALAGVLAVGPRTFEISAPQGPPLAGAGGLGPPAAPAGLAAVALTLAAAFLGGLILNLMPCVFPILAMKAGALVGHAHEPGRARLQAVAYLAGVLAAFLALGGGLIAARAAGQAVGWGFQLQSPGVIAALTLVMLAVALDLSGVFEVGGSLQAAAGQAGGPERGGVVRAALTGLLAVAVAAPCTAPFMAGAIGFALTQSAPIALGVFAALGLGMAAPFVMLASAPGMLRLLPRPGAWMDGLKKALAFPMYGAAAWLAWVYAESAGADRLVNLLAAAVFVAFAAWLFGASQRARAVGRRGALPTRAGAAAALAAGLAVVFWPSGARLTPEPFSPDRLASLRAAHKPVFVNFTAAWCVTCQVNDRLALSGAPVADAFGKAGVVYLKGDWTDRNAVIEQALAEHGRAGVPLYLMYPANGGDPEVLPQILTEGTVVDAAKKAG
jgi:thiol:disulfide interchange protein DsbD